MHIIFNNLSGQIRSWKWKPDSGYGKRFGRQGSWGHLQRRSSARRGVRCVRKFHRVLALSLALSYLSEQATRNATVRQLVTCFVALPAGTRDEEKLVSVPISVFQGVAIEEVRYSRTDRAPRARLCAFI